MLFLDEDELYELTGYRQREKQKQALASMGIKFRSRPADGYPLVQRAPFVEPKQVRYGTPAQP